MTDVELGVHANAIQIANTPITSLAYHNEGNHGVLDLFNGGKLAGAINFDGHYTTSEFVLANNVITLK